MVGWCWAFCFARNEVTVRVVVFGGGGGGGREKEEKNERKKQQQKTKGPAVFCRVNLLLGCW